MLQKENKKKTPHTHTHRHVAITQPGISILRDGGSRTCAFLVMWGYVKAIMGCDPKWSIIRQLCLSLHLSVLPDSLTLTLSTAFSHFLFFIL